MAVRAKTMSAKTGRHAVDEEEWYNDGDTDKRNDDGCSEQRRSNDGGVSSCTDS